MKFHEVKNCIDKCVTKLEFNWHYLNASNAYIKIKYYIHG